jgi:hypothetical protein
MNETVIYAGLILCSILPLTACGEDGTSGDGTDGMGIAAGMYVLQVPDSFWTEPPGIGSDIGVFVPEFLFDVSETTVTLGTAKEGVQDPCTPTQVVQATMEDSQVVVGPIDYQMHLVSEANQAHVNTIIRDLTFTNVLPPVDDEGGRLSAALDAREIYPLFHLVGPDAEAVCAALESFDTECEPCPQDGERFCLTIVAVRLEAAAAPEIEMGPVDGASLGAECADVIP